MDLHLSTGTSRASGDNWTTGGDGTECGFDTRLVYELQLTLMLELNNKGCECF